MVNLTTFMVAATALLLGVQALDEVTARKIRDELRRANIIPEAIEDFEPTARLRVRFDEHFDLRNGELLTPEQTLVVPSVWFDAPSSDTEYTLAMINLDSNGSQVRHWIATNVKGGDKQGIAFLSQAPTHVYTSYRGPTPPPGSQPHRVAFVLFKQEDTNQTFTPEIESTSLRNRDFFDLKQFAKDNHLTPISGAYFYTEHQKGFSQNYPPVSKEELGDIKESNLIDDVDDTLEELLDDVGEIVGDTGKEHPPKSEPIPPVFEPIPEPSRNPEPHHGLVGGVVDIIDDLLGDLGIDIEIGGDDDDDLIDIGPNKADDRGAIKAAGLVGDLLDDLLGIDIDVHHHDDVGGIEILDGYPVSRVIAVDPTKPVVGDETESGHHHHGLVAGVIDILDDVLNDLGLGIDIGHDEDNGDFGDVLDINVRNTVIHKPIREAGLLGDLLDDLVGDVGKNNTEKVLTDKKSGVLGDLLDDLVGDVGKNSTEKNPTGKKGGVLGDLLDDLVGDIGKNSTEKVLADKKDGLLGDLLDDLVGDIGKNSTEKVLADKKDGLLGDLLEDLFGDVDTEVDEEVGEGQERVREPKDVHHNGGHGLIGDLLEDLIGDVDVNVDDHENKDHHEDKDVAIGLGDELPLSHASASLSGPIAAESAHPINKDSLLGDVLHDVVGDVDVEVGGRKGKEHTDRHRHGDETVVIGLVNGYPVSRVIASQSVNDASVPFNVNPRINEDIIIN